MGRQKARPVGSPCPPTCQPAKTSLKDRSPECLPRLGVLSCARGRQCYSRSRLCYYPCVPPSCFGSFDHPGKAGGREWRAALRCEHKRCADASVRSSARTRLVSYKRVLEQKACARRNRVTQLGSSLDGPTCSAGQQRLAQQPGMRLSCHPSCGIVWCLSANPASKGRRSCGCTRFSPCSSRSWSASRFYRQPLVSLSKRPPPIIRSPPS